MPAMSVGKRAARALSRIAESACFVSSGLRPRSMSFAPSSTISASASAGSDPAISLKPVRGSIARHPGIEDIDVPTFGAKRRLQAIGEGLAGGQAKAGGQAVSEDNEANRLGRSRRSRRQNRRERRRLDEEQPMPI